MINRFLLSLMIFVLNLICDTIDMMISVGMKNLSSLRIHAQKIFFDNNINLIRNCLLMCSDTLFINFFFILYLAPLVLKNLELAQTVPLVLKNLGLAQRVLLVLKNLGLAQRVLLVLKNPELVRRIIIMIDKFY